MTVNASRCPSLQVGSHYHFAEVNPALEFDRQAALGYRLNIPAGTAARFEPGDTKEVTLVAYGGRREVYGFRGKVNGALDGKASATLSIDERGSGQ